MNLILAAIIGWCGTGWPIIHIPPTRGPGPLPPGDFGPPGCWICTRIAGAIGGFIVVAALGPHFADAGMLGTVTLAFFGGSVLGDITNSVSKMFAKQ